MYDVCALLVDNWKVVGLLSVVVLLFFWNYSAVPADVGKVVEPVHVSLRTRDGGYKYLAFFWLLQNATAPYIVVLMN